MKLDADTLLRDLTWTPRLEIKCSNPFCPAKVVYCGQYCAVCQVQQEQMRETLRQQKCGDVHDDTRA